MKILIKIILLLFCFSCFSQKSQVFENLELNENMRLIGMYPHYDQERTYESYNFIIEDSKVLDSIAKIIVKGKEVMNQSTRNEVSIYLYDRDNKIKTWSFDPKYKFIRVAGKSYEFDADQILALTAKYGFRYTFKKELYQTQEQFDDDYSLIKSNPKLLFLYEPDFKHEGTFEVSYRRSGKFKNPKVISEYLSKKISEFRKENEYRVYYVLDEFNLKNPNQYTMTIESDFGLFELFEDKKTKKKDWKPKEYSAYIFLKD